MDDATLLQRMWATMRAFFHLLPAASEGGHAVERPGVLGTVTPAVPERSVVNSVLYDDADALEAALGDLGRAYEDAGVRAWTVWVHPGDQRAAALLESAGHRLDANPAAMVRELDGIEPLMPDGAEWSRDVDLATVLTLNDRAYGWEDARPWSRALGGLDPNAVHRYLATLDGDAACTLMTVDHEGDCGIWLVATLPSARGRGLAGALLAQALVDARDRGCTTTSLQATKLGEPVYARLGYRSLGSIEMWERRGS